MLKPLLTIESGETLVTTTERKLDALDNEVRAITLELVATPIDALLLTVTGG